MQGLKLIHDDIIKGVIGHYIIFGLMGRCRFVSRCQLSLLVRWQTLVLTTLWWRHQMETFSALLAICAGNSLVPGEFPTQRPVTRSFHVFFDLHLNKPWSKQSWGWWFETLSRPLWRHCNVFARQSSTFLWQVPKYYLTVLLSDEAPIIQ